MRRSRSPLAPALLLAAAACGGGDEGPPTRPIPPGQRVATIEVTPSTTEADALGAERQFEATARDGSGVVVADVSFAWSAAPDSVASVDEDGTATAEGEGIATIEATASGGSGSAVLRVEQVPDSVALRPGEVTVAAEGDTARLEAEAFDANAHPIGATDFRWSSSDTAVAVVDGDGTVTGRSPGTVRIEATAVEGTAGAVGGSRVTVEAPVPVPAPSITSVDPLVELDSATVRGRDFAPDASDNSVTVDGVEAAVMSASEGELVVEVPQLGCRPRHVGEVVVATAGGVDSASSVVTPDEDPVRLDVGQQTLLREPDEFCLQFEDGSTDERYLVGVQSLSATVGSLTPVRVVARAEGEDQASAVARSLDGGEPPGTEVLPPDRQPRLQRHRAAELRLRRWERSRLDPAGSIAARRPTGSQRVARSVSGSVQVGDTVSLRVPDISTSLPCRVYSEVGARVEAVGTRGVLVADTANPSGGFTQADYGEFSDRMDAGIFGTLVDHFGSPTDIDANDRVIVVVSKAVNETTGALGFVFAGDLFPRSTSDGSPSCASSDEGEIYYGRAPDPEGIHADPYPTDRARSETPFVMSHELTHVIQHSRRLDADQSFMASRVSEAQATLGEEVVGHAVTGRSTGGNYGAVTMFNADESDEIDWYANGFGDLATYFGFESDSTRVVEAPDACGWWLQDPSPCAGRALWYGVGWSFLRWASDHFGSSLGSEERLQRTIIDRDGRGWEKLASIVGEPLEELMARWSATLYLDDRNAASSGRLSWPSWNLFDYERNTVPTAHLLPLEEGFRDWRATGEVRASSTRYIAIEGSDRPWTAVRLEGGDDGRLPRHMQVWVVRIR